MLTFLLSGLYSQTKTYNDLVKSITKLKTNEQINKIAIAAHESIENDSLSFHPIMTLLKAKADKENNIVAKNYYYCLFAEYYIDKENTAQAEKMLKLTQNDMPKITNFSLIANIYERYGDLYTKLDLYDKALDAYEKSLHSAKIINDMALIGDLYSKIGIINMNISEYDKALSFSKLALKIRLDRKNTEKITQSYSTIGNILMKKSDFQNSLEYHFKALKNAEADKDTLWLSNCYNNIGSVYNALNETTKALEYYLKGIEYRKNNDPDAFRMASSYNNIAIIYRKLKDYKQSLYYFKKSLEIKKKHNDTLGIATTHNNIGLLYISMEDFSQAKTHLSEGYKLFTKIGNKSGQTSSLSNFAYLYKSMKNYDLALEYALKANKLAFETKNKQHTLINYGTIVRLYELKGNYKEAYKYFRIYFDYKDSLYNVELSSRISEIQTKYDSEKKENENVLLRKDKQINDLKLLKSTYWRNFLVVCLFMTLVILALILIMYRNQRHTNFLIHSEKEKTERLMLNILPFEIAKELKEKGKTSPQSFDNVTVLFSDLVDFTQITADLEPEIVINELNDIFTHFDYIMEKNQCERIKTIGDAYLSVCGMPENNARHAHNIVQSAIEIIQYIQNRNENHQIKWSVRIGIHTGRVVGGVVGTKKYIYDIFGDTINTTSRIENCSLPMQVSISETTYLQVKNDFNFTQENKFEIKGKGVVKTYCLYTEI